MVKTKDAVVEFSDTIGLTGAIKSTGEAISHTNKFLSNDLLGASGKQRILPFAQGAEYVAKPSLPNYTTEDLKASSNIVNNNSKRNNIAQKNSYNMVINVPKGTTDEMAKELMAQVTVEIEKHQSLQNEKLLIAIGAH